MGAPRRDGRSGNGGEETLSIAPTPAALVETPLAFLLAEHFRQREMARLLVLAADGVANARMLHAALKFLRRELPRHVEDEELFLFPQLRRHCLNEDGIDRLLHVLTMEHEDDRRLGAETADVVSALIAGELVTPTAQSRLRSFAAHLCGHIALENAILLPIARVRLDEAALEPLARRLRQRCASE